MAKPKSQKIEMTIEDERKSFEEDSAYKTVKSFLNAYANKQTVNFEKFMESVEELCEDYENQFPKESDGYPEGSSRKMHIIRGVMTFKFIAPYKIKDQDRVEWGWETLHDLSERLEEMTGGNISLEVEYPFKYRDKFTK